MAMPWRIGEEAQRRRRPIAARTLWAGACVAREAAPTPRNQSLREGYVLNMYTDPAWLRRPATGERLHS